MLTIKTNCCNMQIEQTNNHLIWSLLRLNSLPRNLSCLDYVERMFRDILKMQLMDVDLFRVSWNRYHFCIMSFKVKMYKPGYLLAAVDAVYIHCTLNHFPRIVRLFRLVLQRRRISIPCFSFIWLGHSDLSVMGGKRCKTDSVRLSDLSFLNIEVYTFDGISI